MPVDTSLDPETEAAIAELVSTKRFESEADVVREGVRLVRERERRLAALDEGLQRGLADVEAGRTSPAEEVFDRVEAKIRAIADAKR